jgi:hypothetical protein
VITFLKVFVIPQIHNRDSEAMHVDTPRRALDSGGQLNFAQVARLESAKAQTVTLLEVAPIPV